MNRQAYIEGTQRGGEAMNEDITSREFDYPVPLRRENGPQTVQRIRVFSRSAIDSGYFDVVLAADGSAIGAISEARLREVLGVNSKGVNNLRPFDK